MNNSRHTSRGQAGGSKASKKKAYQGYTFKERLLPSILLSLLAPLTIAGIAPFEIFSNNMDEFKFVLGDFWGLCLLLALATSAVLATILLVCRGRVFDVVFGLIFGLSVMFFVQSTFLSLSQTSLGGDGTSAVMPPDEIAVNTVIWVLVTMACILVMLLLNRFKDTVRLIATMVLVVALFMSFVSFLTVSLTTDVYNGTHPSPSLGETTDTSAEETDETEIDPETGIESESESTPIGGAPVGTPETETAPADGETAASETEPPRMLTVENLTSLAQNNNVVIFVVDRFSNEYYHEAVERCPEIFSEMGGFTFFDDYISLYPRTYPAIPHLLTGVENDFSLSRIDYFQKAYTEAPMMHALADAGFDINVYTDSYYGYNDTKDMEDYTTNVSGKISYKIVEKPRLSWDMIRLGLYRSLPLAAQPLVGDLRTPTFDRYVKYTTEHDVFSTDMKSIYTHITAEDFSLRDASKGYALIHMSGCHMPNRYDENFGSPTAIEQRDSTVGMKQSFKIISRYIQEMKRLGVYENATIIILGDHCDIGSDRDFPYYPHLTSLFVKPAGRSTGDINVSNAPITTDDVLATVLKAANVPMLEDDWRTVFEIGENEMRTRRYLFQRLLPNARYEEGVYEITGSGKILANWRLTEVRPLGKSIYN